MLDRLQYKIHVVVFSSTVQKYKAAMTSFSNPQLSDRLSRDFVTLIIGDNKQGRVQWNVRLVSLCAQDFLATLGVGILKKIFI